MPFILRRVTSENSQSNRIIGDVYHLVYDDRKLTKEGEIDKTYDTPMSEQYNLLLKDQPKDNHKDIHMFIISEKEEKDKFKYVITPIYCPSTYYIMTESGKTFSTIRRIDFD